MLKIRLMRIGAKKKPFYRVVVVDERAKRTGAYIELLGTYNPLTEPKEILLKQDRIDYWIKQGAKPSTGYLRMIGKAPQRPPRKPKKSHAAEAPRDKEEKKVEPSAISNQTSEKTIQEEKPVEEVVGEETKSELEKPEEAKSETDKASGEVERTTDALQSDKPSHKSESK